jgi:aspartyl-tRNA(Asn)/glutamyl-tRNA(Gln) amidotransferase subunit A
MHAADLSLSQAASAIAAGELSPVELTEACLGRARDLEPAVHAFAALDEEGARRQAAALGDELARGGSRGPLHGVPVGIKDVIDVQGLPTRAGSRVTDGAPVPADAAVVAVLRAAGAVIVGKTATHEFALGVTTPQSGNPWDAARLPGGSSGGSAIAVAVGECPVALGTDTAGSVRIPSALCGVSGLKARRSALPMGGVVPVSRSMDACGPLARSAADLALVWEAQTGQAVPSRSRLRVGVPREWPAWVGPEIRHRVVEAAEAVALEGGVVEADLPPFDAWTKPRGRVTIAETLDAHRRAGWYPARREAYGEEVLGALEAAERLSSDDLAAARRALAALVLDFREALARLDVVALPVTTGPAPDRDTGEREAERDARLTRELTRLCGPVNACDLAAVAVPCAPSPEGLPLGVQFVAADEPTALAAALAYQEATDFHERRPPLVAPQAALAGGGEETPR